MRTRFVIHKNLLSKVFRVLPRYYARVNGTWNPEDILVENPDRESAWFILPKSEYIPCDSKGQPIRVQGTNAKAAQQFNSGSQPEG